MKPPKKQNNMLYSIFKCKSSCREINNIKKIRSKETKKHESSSINSYRSDYNFSLSINSG